jgi:hypothetical protein
MLAAAKPLAVEGDVTQTAIHLHEAAERLRQVVGHDRLEHVMIGRMARRLAPLLVDAEGPQCLRRKPAPEAKNRHQIIGTRKHRA